MGQALGTAANYIPPYQHKLHPQFVQQVGRQRRILEQKMQARCSMQCEKWCRFAWCAWGVWQGSGVLTGAGGIGGGSNQGR